jgi:RNA polymerase sigma-70 factor, ECF subfamily
MDRLEELFVAGDVDAFEILFRQYQGQVYAWIVRIVRNPASAEDLTIETFWRIYQHRKRFNPGRPFGRWARRIATRLAIDYLRSADRFSAEPCEPTTRPADPGLLLQRELRKQIEKAFSLLPARLRVAATLALVEELPYSEIAEALGISLSAVKMRVARAMQTLRKSLERIGFQP